MRLSPLVGLSVAAFSANVFAQGFELDLSAPEVPAEFRPSLGVLGVASGEATDDPLINARAHLLEIELLKSATGNPAFGRVVNPTEAAAGVKDAAEARKCIDYACLEALAKALKVDRLIKGTVTKSGPASLLTLHAFDSGLTEVLTATVESSERQEKAKIGGFAGIAGKSQAQKDKEFVKQAIPVFFELLEKIKTSNGKIAVDSAETSSVATFNDGEGGIGTFEKVVPRGKYEVKVSAAGYLPFTAQVTVEPLKLSAVKVVLIAKPLENKGPAIAIDDSANGTPVIKRPGLYIAAAGVVCIAIGLAVGLGAKSVEKNAVDKDGDGAVDITRAAAKSAASNATVANVLVGAGAAAAVGGGVWFFLTKGPVTKVRKEAEPPPAEGSGFGVMVGYGSSF